MRLPKKILALYASVAAEGDGTFDACAESAASLGLSTDPLAAVTEPSHLCGHKSE